MLGCASFSGPSVPVKRGAAPLPIIPGEREMSRFWKLAAFLVAIAGLALGTATEAQAFIIWPRATGAQVTAVLPYSPARRVGLEVGDIVVAIDGLPVRTPDDFTALTAFKRQVVL